MDTEFSGSVRTTALPQHSRQTPLGAMTVVELARAADVTPHVVRHYTRIGLLTPKRDQTNGYKLFSRADFKRLLFIRRSKLLGYTLSDIRNILADAQHRWSPRFVKHSVSDGKKVKIAAIDPDSRSRPQPQSLMEFAGQVLITGARSKRRVAYRLS